MHPAGCIPRPRRFRVSGLNGYAWDVPLWLASVWVPSVALQPSLQLLASLNPVGRRLVDGALDLLEHHGMPRKKNMIRRCFPSPGPKSKFIGSSSRSWIWQRFPVGKARIIREYGQCTNKCNIDEPNTTRFSHTQLHITLGLDYSHLGYFQEYVR